MVKVETISKLKSYYKLREFVDAYPIASPKQFEN